MSIEEDAAPLLEPAQIDGLIAAAGVEGVRQILDAFWRSTDTLLTLLKTQREEGDFAGAARTAHAIKGSSSNVGAALLAIRARDLEAGARNENPDALAAAIGVAEQTYVETRAAIETHLAHAA